MDLCSTADLAAVEAEIDSQTDVVARASSHRRYSEILRLQMLREMRDILAEAYRFRREIADIREKLESDTGEPTA